MNTSPHVPSADDISRIAEQLLRGALDGAPPMAPVDPGAVASTPPAPPPDLVTPTPPVNLDGMPRPTLSHAATTSTASVSPVHAAPSTAFAQPAASPTGLDLTGLRAFIGQVRGSHHRRHPTVMPPLAGHAPGSMTPGSPVSLASIQSGTFDVATVRRDFPILNERVHGKELVWLDNAATTQKPQAVIDALSHFYAHDNSNIHRAAHALAARATEGYEGARKTVQEFLGATRVEEIIFVRGCTEGINLIANILAPTLGPGDEIVLPELEHHANIVPWQMVAERTGAVIRVAPINDRGEVILEAYERLLGSRTRVVSMSHASNSLGTILPVEMMTGMAKAHGATVVVDGAQSVAHFPVDVRRIGCDFYAFSGHKIFGPTGIGAVYATTAAQETLPPWQGGGNMIRDVTFARTTYSDPPAKFEAGTPNIADAIGLAAALDYVTRLGREQVAAYEHSLLEHATAALSGIPGLRLIGTAPAKVGVLSFVMEGKDPIAIGKALDREGIAVRAGHHCAQPSLRHFGLEATVRPSLAFYNTTAEIDHLASVIRRLG